MFGRSRNPCLSHDPLLQRVALLTCIAWLVLYAAPASAQQAIRVDGSTGTAPLVRALGKVFTEKSSVAIEVGKGLGTRARFEALQAAKIDIVMASHGLDVEAIAKKGMVVYRVAMTPVLFAVHESVKLDRITEAQVCAIYAGKIRNWSELGGNDLAVAALVRPESEVDMEVVRAGLTCFKALQLHGGVQIQNRAGDMARALAQTAGAVGMTSATVVAQSRGRIKSLALDGVVADEANVVAGRYRLTRDAFLVTRGKQSNAVKAFIDFIQSEEGSAIISDNRAIAVRPRG